MKRPSPQAVLRMKKQSVSEKEEIHAGYSADKN